MVRWSQTLEVKKGKKFTLRVYDLTTRGCDGEGGRADCTIELMDLTIGTESYEMSSNVEL